MQTQLNWQTNAHKAAVSADGIYAGNSAKEQEECIAPKVVKDGEDDMLRLTHFKGPGPFSFAWCISKLQNIAGCNIADSSAAIGATRRLLQLRCKIQEDFANCIIVWANKDKKRFMSTA